MTDARDLVRRAPHRPIVWLGEGERASLVARRAGAHFPATAVKERDFVLPPILRAPRDPVG